MSLRVQPKTLADALNRVVNAVERRTTMPILSHVLLSASKGKLTLRGTDLDTEIETHIECEGELAPTCAPADRMQSTIARLAERGETTISLDGQTLTLSSGRARFTMPVLLAEGFPTLSNDDVGCSFTIEGKALATLFSACGFAMANSSDRLYLNGTFLFAGTIGNGEGKALCGVATDGRRFSAREIPADLPSDFPDVIVPRKTVLTLGKLIEDFESVAVEISASRFIATFGPTRFVSKLVEQQYPDWRRIVPDCEPCISYDADRLSDAVSTAFSAVRHDKKTHGIRMAFGTEETEFSTRSVDGTAEGFDVCSHSRLSDPVLSEIAIIPEFVLSAITALSAETIEIGFGESEKMPVVFTGAALPDRKVLIMRYRM